METLKAWTPLLVLVILGLISYQMFWKKDAATTPATAA